MLRERFIEKKGKNDRQMSVLPLHLPTYSKNRHFSFFSPYMSQDASKFLPIVGLFLSFLPNLLVFSFLICSTLSLQKRVPENCRKAKRNTMF